MANTYTDFANLTRSSKIVLCQIEPKQRHAVFALDAGAVYKKSMNYFVIAVSEDNSDLSEGADATLNASEWWFDAPNGELYI